jgi:hypothetical protein
LDKLSDTIWPGEEIASWDNLATRAGKVAERQAAGGTILLRGQPQQWTLRPSLIRAIPHGVSGSQLAEAERDAMIHFRSQAHLYTEEALPPEHIDGSVELAWWTLMQHYGAPTRLLDWTSSPYVAAYFAAEQSPDDDGVILVIDADRLNAHFHETSRALDRQSIIRAADEPPGLMALTPERKTRRLVTHQGYFTVATHPDAVHDELLHAAGAILRRWIIPSDLKPLVLRHLRTMNVSAQTLFPGLDGLGRSAGELIKTITP